MAHKRAALASDTLEAWSSFGKTAFREGELLPENQTTACRGDGPRSSVSLV